MVLRHFTANGVFGKISQQTRKVSQQSRKISQHQFFCEMKGHPQKFMTNNLGVTNHESFNLNKLKPILIHMFVL